MTEFCKEDIFLVTGASSGIGKAIALMLNEQGASVIAIGRNEERLNALKSEASDSSSIFCEVKELTENIESLPVYVKELKEKYGKLKGLVCAAGVDNPRALQIIEEQMSREVFDINYFAPVFLAKGFADKRNRTQNAGIVFIASSAGVYPDKGQTIYAASKAALIASMKSISKELAPKGVRINSISPAYVETPMYFKNLENIGTNIEDYPLGIGKPEDVANMAVYLLSEKARWITGQNYVMDGGVF